MRILDEQVVVITGAGSGIGRVSAQLFAQEGAKVVCADLRRSWADETVRRILQAGGTAVAVTCDVSQPAEVADLVAASVAEFERLDVMFNNAGIASPRMGIGLDEHTPEEFDRLVAVNGRGVFLGCRDAMQQFKRQDGGGVILNTASIAGMVGMAGAVYGATKAMVIQLTRSAAIEGAPHGIRANCICPGGLPTTNFGRPDEQAFQDASVQALDVGASMHPLSRIITPEECAAAALFLASDQSSNITGVAIPVDGGYVAQ